MGGTSPPKKKPLCKTLPVTETVAGRVFNVDLQTAAIHTGLDSLAMLYANARAAATKASISASVVAKEHIKRASWIEGSTS